MSLTTCKNCTAFIDTDDEPEAYNTPDEKPRCEACRLELETEEEEN